MLRRAVSKPNAPAAGGGAALLREQRRKKRIEKAISLLERRGRILKAVVEVSPPYALALDAQYEKIFDFLYFCIFLYYLLVYYVNSPLNILFIFFNINMLDAVSPMSISPC